MPLEGATIIGRETYMEVIPPVTEQKEQRTRPIYSWAVNADPGTYEQAANLSRLPFAVHHIALMPDAHKGYGMPIGGVLAAERAVVPYAVGVDIGCGVILAQTDIHETDLAGRNLESVLNYIERKVPVGEGRHHVLSTDKNIDLVTLAERYVGNSLGAPVPGSVNLSWVAKAAPQLGTLGGGNHFIEIQKDENGRIYVMIHSGSRVLGKLICDYYYKAALEDNLRYNSDLPDEELAYIPMDTPLFDEYMEAMRYAMTFAEANRTTMMARVLESLMEFTTFSSSEIIAHVHHNYAAWENHYGRNVIVHRKGAVRARKDEVVLIPGSMGTSTYVARGLGNKKSFETCQHGAGRAVPRGQTHKMWSTDDVKDQMRQAGVAMVSGNWGKAMEEAPLAYKDIEEVMRASIDLIEPTMKLLPVGVVKG